MAPEVIVPMNFGRRMLSSPTHNTLKLNTSKGGFVYASSVILSFNSPVIDHMTTTLHMTSVDMLEFSEAAVRMFVDAAYSGTAEGLNREIFRDVNKMANVFELSWLVDKCVKHFIEVAESVQTASYPDLLYLFEEAGFVLKHLNSKYFAQIAIRIIEKMGFKQQFIEKYLENADQLSEPMLNMVINLAGSETNLVVKAIADQLSEQFKIQGTSHILSSHKYVLNRCDLNHCKNSDRELFNLLFDVLGNFADNVNDMKWILELRRKSSNHSARKVHAVNTICSSQSLQEISSDLFSTKCNDIPNLFHNLDMELTFDDLLVWLSKSDEVENLLMAIEAVWTWSWYRRLYTKKVYSVNHTKLISELIELRQTRSWRFLPYDFMKHHVCLSDQLYFDREPFCNASQDTISSVIIDCTETCSEPLTLLSKDSKLTFQFKPPSISQCDLPGQCGFILKTVPDNTALWKLALCTGDEDYRNESVHFHTDFMAKDMHIFFHHNSYFYPLSWLSWLYSSDAAPQRNDWQSKFRIHDHDGRFKVLYDLVVPLECRPAKEPDNKFRFRDIVSKFRGEASIEEKQT